MRRLLRKLCCLDTNLGDTTSLANAEIIKALQPLVMETVLKERKTPAPEPVNNNAKTPSKRSRA